MPKQKTLEDYKFLAIKNDGEYILDIIPKNCGTNIEGWKCKNNHKFSACFSNIQRYIWCVKCNGYKIKLSEYKSLAISKGGEYISDNIPNNSHDQTQGWICFNKHTWSASYQHIKHNNSWCPTCVGLKPKKIHDYKNIAIEKGGIYILNIIPENVTISIEGWSCNLSHIWSACYSSIQGNSWCPECAGNKPKKIDDYKLLAVEKGGNYILDTIPENTNVSIKAWSCNLSHIWTASYSNIKKSSWCPHPKCSQNQSSQISFKWLYHIETTLNVKLQHALNDGEHKIPNTKYKVDGYHQETNTCYEFHGCFWHGCIKCFDQDKINPISKLSYKKLYEKTLIREEYIKLQGYNLVTVWECDFRKLIKLNEPIGIENEDYIVV